jgi:hypothetical protein
MAAAWIFPDERTAATDAVMCFTPTPKLHRGVFCWMESKSVQEVDQQHIDCTDKC